MEDEKTPESKGLFKNQSKLTFLLGIFIGIAVVSTFAFFFTLVVLLNDGEESGNVASADGAVAGQADVDPGPIPADGAAPQAQANIELIVTIDDNTPIRGNKDAKVTLIEFSDFECPYSSRHEETMKRIVEEFPDDVRLVYKHFPLSFHNNAQKAAEASECAGEQGKFWEMHDKLYEAASNKELSVEKYKELAKDLGLNTGQFDSCLDDGTYASKVQSDMQVGVAAGVEGTPGTFINGTLISGAVPYDSFVTVIQGEL